MKVDVHEVDIKFWGIMLTKNFQKKTVMEHLDIYSEDGSSHSFNSQIMDLSIPAVMVTVIFQLLLFTILIMGGSSASPKDDSPVPILPPLTLPGLMSVTVIRDKKPLQPVNGLVELLVSIDQWLYQFFLPSGAVAGASGATGANDATGASDATGPDDASEAPGFASSSGSFIVYALSALTGSSILPQITG